MQAPERRDAKTLVITTGLGLFVLVLAVGALVLRATHSTLGLTDDAANDGFALICALAAIALVLNVWPESRRLRRRSR